MRPTRCLLALAAVVAAVVAVPAGAAPLPRLTATTVITATHSGYLDVVLPHGARLNPARDKNPDTSVAGGGRLVGVWLTQGTDFWGSGSTLQVLRLPGFAGGTVQTEGSTDGTFTCTGPLPTDPCDATPATAIVLAPGRYRLWVLADGARVTVTLHLAGLVDDVTSLTPTRPLLSVEKLLPAREGVGDSQISFGDALAMPGQVVGGVVARAKAAPGATVDGYSECTRQDTGPTPPFGYASPCPGGMSGYSQERVGPTGGGETFFGFVGTGLLSKDAPVGLGGSFTDDQGVTLLGTLGLWLQLPPG